MELHDLKLGNYYLFDDKEDIKKPIRLLSRQEVDNLQSANKVLYEFQYYNRRMREIELNYAEYQGTIEKFAKEMNALNNRNIDEERIENIYVQANRTFNNFVTSLKVFTTHVEARIKKRYGEASREFLTFKKTTALMYDTYFSYKLLMNLRDYALHKDYAIDRISQESSLLLQPNTFKVELAVAFNKIKLLEDKKLAKKLKWDLRKYSDFFPVKFVMEEITKPMHKIFNVFISIEKPYFVSHANILVSFTNENQGSQKTSFGKVFHEPSGVLRVDTVLLPMNIIEKLREKIISEEASE